MGNGPKQRPQSRLPQGGENLFQRIKRVSSEAEARDIELVKLSIGQPEGPALLSARIAASEAVLSDAESMHEYQDNGCPGVPDFAKRFAQTHVETDLSREGIDFLPIPGIKPMLEHIPTACGGDADNKKNVVTTTNPGYPTPRDWAKIFWKHNVTEPPLTPENDFLLKSSAIPVDTDVIMMNYPHNPSGQIASREWLEELCAFAQANGIRLFNDAAYISLSHSSDSTALADVAVDFPGLSWIEAYSASKLLGNATGWRVGTMVGSSDFIADMKTIKGNADSGLAAPMAAGAIYAAENDRPSIEKKRLVYERRLNILGALLKEHGMQPAIEPKAGFFYLWLAPTTAFGESMNNAEHFNFTMIEKAGLVGVHFEPYIRYSVTSDIEANIDKIDKAFEEAAVAYE